MFENTRDYLKCVVANKFVLGSYILLFSSCGKDRSDLYSGLMIGTSVVILNTAQWGRETYIAYKRTQRHIERFGKINPEFKETLSSWYCTQAGVKLAIKEAGLEDKL